MPKQILKITDFHGGLNNNSDPRDLEDDQLSQAQNIMVDEIGRIRNMGGSSSHVAGTSDGSSGTEAALTTNHGYNLFDFSHDMTSFGHYDILKNGITGQSTGSLWTVNPLLNNAI